MRRVPAPEPTTARMYPTCPRCGDFIPRNESPGEYPGAISRTDNATEICSTCGQAEGVEEMFGTLLPQELWHASQQFAGEL